MIEFPVVCINGWLPVVVYWLRMACGCRHRNSFTKRRLIYGAGLRWFSVIGST